MPFLDGDIRASHTIRIFGTNHKAEILTEIWLDIERIDVFGFSTQIEDHWQGGFLRLHWLDDPDEFQTQGGAGNEARVKGNLKICSPDEKDQENPDEWIPVQINIEMDMNESGDFQVFSRIGNRNDAENLVRLVGARRCIHRDTIVDKIAEQVAQNNPDWKQMVFSSDQYDFIKDTENTSDYIEVQYMSTTMKLSTRKEDAEKDQWVQFNLKNSHYLNFTSEAKGPVNTEHGFDPPWALDPWQAIVNVNFTGSAVEFFDKET